MRRPSLYSLDCRAEPQHHPACYRLSTVHTEAQAVPPTLNVAATFAFFFCKPCEARPISWVKQVASMAMPVAPTGWPLAINPPERLMPHSPSGPALPSTQYLAPSPGLALPIT